jgi:Holliday junction resolvase
MNTKNYWIKYWKLQVGSPSKAKGNRYEREIVNHFKSFGFNCQRAYGSNGKSLGLEEDVDVLINSEDETISFTIQCKIRKKLPQYLELGNCDAVFFRENNGKTKVLIDLDKITFFLSGWMND